MTFDNLFDSIDEIPKLASQIVHRIVHAAKRRIQIRLLFFRYIFLIFLGYRLVVRGIVLNVLTVSLSIISIVAVYLFEVKGVDWTPFFFDSRSTVSSVLVSFVKSAVSVSSTVGMRRFLL